MLVFAVIKTDTIDSRKNNNITDLNNNDLQQEICFETFQIFVEINRHYKTMRGLTIYLIWIVEKIINIFYR